MAMTPFLVYMHGMYLTFGKPFVRKEYNILVFLILSTKTMEVSIELSEDYYCDLNVPIPNKYTITLIVTWISNLELSSKIMLQLKF